jgi:hypothetical protein
MNKYRIKNLFCLIGLTFLISSCGSQRTLQVQDLFQNQVQDQITVQSDERTDIIQNGQIEPIINTVFKGTVVELLPEDNIGLTHQKFMFKITGGQNGKYNGKVVIVAHNTEIAPHVPLKIGSMPEIKGDLLTGESPMVLHWTHKDPSHKHPDGYIKLTDQFYQ